MDEENRLVAEAAEILRRSSSVVVLTGAGVSAESGIPTFRGAGGLWRNFSPEELATPHAFSRNPKLVWEWYNWRRSIIKKAKPNPAHTTIAELERIFDSFTLITQNIDGLHRKAGSRNIIEFHGNIWKERCTSCTFTRKNERIYDESELPPKCDKCGGIMRPSVVWFGEPIPGEVIRESEKAVLGCDTFVSVGTSSVVYPAAGFIEYAVSHNKRTIEINLERTPMSDIVDVSIQGKAGEILPSILEVLQRRS